MSDPGALRAIAGGLYLVPALVWASMAVVAWDNVLKRLRRHTLLRLATAVTGLMAAYYFLGMLMAVLPPDRPGQWPLGVVRDLTLIASAAFLRHIIPLSAARAEPPRRVWLVSHYGLAALVATAVVLVAALPAGVPDRRWLVSRVLVLGYVLNAIVFNLWQTRKFARHKAWGPGGMGELRTTDVLWGAIALPCIVGVIVVMATARGATPRPITTALLEATIGLAAAVPFAVRFLAEAARVFLSAVMLLAAAACVYFGVRALVPAGGIERDLATVLGLVLVLGPGQSWLRSVVDRVVLRPSRRRRGDLQEILDGLSPELGVLECCRRALPPAMRAMGLRGAAILLHDGEAVVGGSFQLEAVQRVWPRGDAASVLPSHAFGGPEFRQLPVPIREAIIEANVVGVLPITSPRRRWGDLLATARMITAIYSDEDVQAWERFAAQFALVLDAADLIARAVAVERSLAHAQKLAAIGELAARIAHDIRNPVAAARSLAQQLSREPGALFAAEHGLILAELERVERHVGALLRFARREEFHFESVDLGELTRGTVEAFRPRLEGAGIELVLEVAEGVTARADREKMRHVLVNLIENALDALGETAPPRHLALAVAGTNGVATLRVTDSGPGVPVEALPHLFEPFFSLKGTGTGLGLAIAQRTVEAHGGRIEARCSAERGMTLAVELPSTEKTA